MCQCLCDTSVQPMTEMNLRPCLHRPDRESGGEAAGWLLCFFRWKPQTVAEVRRRRRLLLPVLPPTSRWRLTVSRHLVATQLSDIFLTSRLKHLNTPVRRRTIKNPSNATFRIIKLSSHLLRPSFCVCAFRN